MPDETTDLSTLVARLDAVERALTDDDSHVDRGAASDADRGSDADAADAAATPAADRRDLEASVAELDRRVSELTAELDAVRGLLGGVEAVNESVERRADLALATAERLAADRGDEGLRVERLPEGGSPRSDDPGRDGEAGTFDGSGHSSDSDSSDGDSADDGSLAARLRGAL